MPWLRIGEENLLDSGAVEAVSALNNGGFVAGWSNETHFLWAVVTSGNFRPNPPVNTGGDIFPNIWDFNVTGLVGDPGAYAVSYMYWDPLGPLTNPDPQAVLTELHYGGTGGAVFLPQSQPNVTPLPDGGYAISRTETAGMTSARIQVYAAGGAPEGDEIIVGPSSSFGTAITTLANGDLAVVWNNGASIYSLVLHEVPGASVQYGDLAANTLAGTAGQDELNGFDGDDMLSGYGGNDSLFGGRGSDTLNGGDGIDRLYGGDGADRLHGGEGVDRMTGGAGADWYFVTTGDLIIDSGPGTRVFASSDYRLDAGLVVDVLSTTLHAGIDPIDLTGNELVNLIYGNAGANLLDGRAGADTMIGLGGDDWYYVDHAGDVVSEVAGGGTNDRIFTGVSYVLGAGVQIEMLTTVRHDGTTAIDLTGNELANVIYGNAGANMIDGKGGADTMVGLGGDDTYTVDNAGDWIFEGASEGANDRVFASASFVLNAGAYVEQIATSNHAGTDAINLTGNELVNIIYGNAGNNILDGKVGADTLVGLGGDDWYYVDNAGDAVSEGAAGGNDRILTSASYTLGAGVQVEKLTTTNNGSIDSINLTGNELANTIYGNAGNNVLDGKAGADMLVGLEGQDSFAFTTALGGGNIDTISGFVAVDDTIRLDDAVFAGLATGALAAGAFNTGSAATQADDRIIYNSATGALLFDADGLGGAAAVQFATLSAGLAMTAADFVVI